MSTTYTFIEKINKNSGLFWITNNITKHNELINKVEYLLVDKFCN